MVNDYVHELYMVNILSRYMRLNRNLSLYRSIIWECKNVVIDMDNSTFRVEYLVWKLSSNFIFLAQQATACAIWRKQIKPDKMPRKSVSLMIYFMTWYTRVPFMSHWIPFILFFIINFTLFSTNTINSLVHSLYRKHPSFVSFDYFII